MRLLSAVLFSFAAGAAPVVAADRHALVVGVNAYEDAPLQLAVPDAMLVGAALEGIGFRVEYVIDPDRAKLIGAMAEFNARVEADDISFFYFSGNGVQVSGESYFFGTDADFRGQDPLHDGFTVEQLIADVTADSHGTHIFVFDACRNDPFPISTHRGLALAPIEHAQTFLLYSTQAGGVVREDPGAANTTFAAALAERLTVPSLSIAEIAREVRAEVMAKSGGEQRPAFYDDTSTDIFLAAEPR